jgi:hypothetical protein
LDTPYLGSANLTYEAVFGTKQARSCKEATMAQWTREEHLTFDIAFALKEVAVPGFRKALKEEDRIAIATTIVEHLKLCGWNFSKPPEPVQ